MRASVMFKAAVFAAVAAGGFFGGEALALPYFSPGVQGLLPATGVVQPLTFQFPLFLANPTVTSFGAISTGRDDVSPYCSFVAASPSIPGIGGGQYVYTYRPLWDSVSMEFVAGAAPTLGNQDAQWNAVRGFEADLRNATGFTAGGAAGTVAPTTGVITWSVTIYIDIAALGTTGVTDGEFYKYSIGY